MSATVILLVARLFAPVIHLLRWLHQPDAAPDLPGFHVERTSEWWPTWDRDAR